MGKNKQQRSKQKKTKKVKRNRDVPDFASISVKRSMTDGGNNFVPNRLYSLMNTQLIDYPRAIQVAAAFQHYKIKKVTLTIKPSSDTFIVGGQATKPNLYYMIDKSGAIPTNVSLEGLKNMGAKPFQLDENNRTISWAPSVLESAMYLPGGAGNSSASKYKISPWLTTTAANVSPGAFVPSAIDHLGIYWWLDQSITGGYQYSVEVEVQFEFKKPLINMLTTTNATPCVPAVLNESPDGIVGGADGV